MRYLKASLAGLAGALLLAAAVAGIDGALAARRLAESVPCGDGDNVCGGAVQFGGWELLVAFVLGFAVAFVWFLRRPPVVDE